MSGGLTRFAGVLTVLAWLCAAPQPAGAATLNRGNQSEPDTLDPNKATGSWEANILGDLFVGLTTEDAAANPIPGAAESWTTSPDGLTWTFIMRRGALWSDGEPVTARDFEFSLRRELDPATASQYASMLFDIENGAEVNGGKVSPDQLGVRAIDDGTLEIRLTHPAPYLPQLLMHQISYPVPAHIVARYGDRWSREHFVSNGPFVLINWVPNDHIEVAKNPRFYDAASVHLDAINYYPTSDADAALRRYRTGELDLNIGFPSPQISFLKRTMPADLHTATLINVRFIAFNLTRQPFDDPRVRRAIALSVMREVVAGKILRAGEKPAYGLVPPGTANYANGPEVDFKSWPAGQRLAEAKRLLSEAGFGPGAPLNFRYRYVEESDSKRTAVALQAMWAMAGMRVNLVGSEKKVHYITVRAMDYDVAEYNWFGDYNDAKNFLYLAQPSANEMNMSKYANPRYEALTRQSDLEKDAGKRADIMKQAEALMLSETPLTPVYFGVGRNIVHGWVSGWRDNLLNIHRSRYLTLDEEGRRNAAMNAKAQAATDDQAGGEQPWYWWLVAAWDWLLGLVCAWFGVACPA